ncbi:hypothetical protein VP01_80g7 [Puccinia sorghi]|uniref:Uncharacterized protein n=1 Tax=Puccinia sorghi TaxID=27349 RepID=A0A0L6UCD1_9BASI|nr:hypothetical protein VP01_80g7 [Puccinia sorghi]
MTNQEYNCHFLSFLELVEPIFEEINDLATNGDFSHDFILGKNDLIMSLVMDFLADSPMRAEITSKPMPENANSPCRVREISVDSKADKSLVEFVQDFMDLMVAKIPKWRYYMYSSWLW